MNADYRFKKKLGEGGMATVFLAKHLKFETDVAIKFLNQEFYKNEHIRKRFIAEARNMFRMSHPNIVRVTDLIDEEECVAFVMEYIEGETLKEYLDRRGKLNNEEIKALFLQMCEALCYVHKQGFVHRDIKPSNFMICADKQVKLLDFGIAKNTDMTASEYTQTGTSLMLGTPMYMSPEQILSTKAVTGQTDIYSLGVVMWQMVQGIKPYDTKTLSAFELQTMIVNENLPITKTVWDSILCKATNKQLSERYQKAEDFMADLKNLDVTLNSAVDETVFVQNVQETIKENIPSTKVKTTKEVKTEAQKEKVQKVSKSKNFILLPVLLILLFTGAYLVHNWYYTKLAADTIGDIERNMIFIEEGAFYMGCQTGYYSRNKNCQEDELPQHNVRLNSYYIGKYEITQSQWEAVMGFNPSKHKDCDNCPVENITLDEIEQFIKKLNDKTHKNFRLPTEAEWEFAAKNRDLNPDYIYAKNYKLGDVAWYKDNSSEMTHEVGLKKRNELGIHDITGNVREWCSDWYDKDYYLTVKRKNRGLKSEQNPQGPDSSPINSKVLRGSSFGSPSKKCRLTNRGYFNPDDGANEWNGLRVAHDNL